MKSMLIALAVAIATLEEAEAQRREEYGTELRRIPGWGVQDAPLYRDRYDSEHPKGVQRQRPWNDYYQRNRPPSRQYDTYDTYRRNPY